MLNLEKLYRDYSIPFVTEGHKHSRPGWINCECPFCTGNEGYHLGYHIENGYYVCWRCGSHHINKVLEHLLKISWSQVRVILRQYSDGVLKSDRIPAKTQLYPFQYPTGVEKEINQSGKNYLISRRFDPDQIHSEWGVTSTGMFSILQTKDQIIDYKRRLFIPVEWNGEIVTFLTRDYTGRSDKKYLVCPEEREILNIKKTLYGKPHKWGGLGIGVEGVTDVWRLGDNAVGVFGIKFTPAQVRLIAKNFKRFPVLFDDDPQAIIQADKLVADLRFRGLDSFSYHIKGDPGEMAQDDADALVRELQTYLVK